MRTSGSVDTLLDQVKSLMTEASKYSARVDHLNIMQAAKHLTLWAIGIRPYPPFIQNNPRLLTKICEVGKEAITSIQTLAIAEFEKQADKLDSECDAILNTPGQSRPCHQSGQEKKNSVVQTTHKR